MNKKKQIQIIAIAFLMILFQGCLGENYGIRLKDIRTEHLETIETASGFDDLMVEGGIIILGEKNTGELRIYTKSSVETKKIDPYTQIVLRNGEIYYKSVYNWNYYRESITDENRVKISEILGSEMIIPLGKRDYILYNPNTGEIKENIGGIERIYMIEGESGGFNKVKISRNVILKYNGNRVEAINFMGYTESIFNVGEVKDFEMTEAGLLYLRENGLYIKDNRGDEKKITETAGDRLAYTNGRVLVYDLSEGRLISINIYW
ncbi:MAG: hypothetical protein AB7T10_06865 [bacterium]